MSIDNKLSQKDHNWWLNDLCTTFEKNTKKKKKSYELEAIFGIPNIPKKKKIYGFDKLFQTFSGTFKKIVKKFFIIHFVI